MNQPLNKIDAASLRKVLHVPPVRPSTGFVVDSACDLPPAFLERYDVHVMPVNLRFGSELLVDTRNEQATRDFYVHYEDNRQISASSIPFRQDEIEKMIMSQLTQRYDNLIFITIASSRSKIFENAAAARNKLEPLLNKSASQRFTRLRDIRVFDSRTMFTGQAVVAYEAIKVSTEDSATLYDIEACINNVSDRVNAYLVPRDLFYMRHRASRRGDESVSKQALWLADKLDIIPVIHAHNGETSPLFKAKGFDGALKRLLEHTKQAIEKGLYTNFVSMSYAGDISDIKTNPEVMAFMRFAREKSIKTKLATMSVTAGINVGPGAFSLAYAA